MELLDSYGYSFKYIGKIGKCINFDAFFENNV
jgi:hypothetical protein